MTNPARLASLCLAVLLAAGATASMAATTAAADKPAPVQVAQAGTGPSTSTQGAAAPLTRNADGQIQNTTTRDWAAVDRNRDGLVSPDEMQSYLERSWR